MVAKVKRDKDRFTLNQYLYDVYAMNKLKLSDSSVQMIGYSLNSMQRFYEREILVAELTDQIVIFFLKNRLQKVAPKTVKRERGDVLAIWRDAHKRGYCEDPPGEIPPVHVPRKVPTAWSVDDVSRMLLACRKLTGEFDETGIAKSDWWASLILFLYDTGARIGAALQVRTADISLEHKGVVLTAENAKTGVEQIIRISDQCSSSIARHYDPKRACVWPFHRHRRQLFARLKHILTLAGLPVGRNRMFHAFRRTNATLTTVYSDINVASRQLGHTSEQMTERYVDPRFMNYQNSADVLPRPKFE